MRMPRNKCFASSAQVKRGLALLYVVFIVAILAVIVAKLSYSSYIDGLVQEQNEKFFQAQFLLESALEVVQAYLLNHARHTSFSSKEWNFTLENHPVHVKLFEISGRFNLNSPYLAPTQAGKSARALQLQRLLSLLATKYPSLSIHVQNLSAYLQKRTIPLQTLRELREVFPQSTDEENPSPSPTLGAENSSLPRWWLTLSPFFTTTDELKINVRTAPLEVLQSLHPSLTPRLASRLRRYYLSGKGSASVRKLASQLQQFTTLTSFSYEAYLHLRFQNSHDAFAYARFQLNRRRNRVALRYFERLEKAFWPFSSTTSKS